MEKLVVQIKPKDGVDLEKFWKDWGEKYATCYSGQSGLTRYIISRFKEFHGGKDDPSRMWGMEEFWYQDKQSYAKAQKAMQKDSKIKGRLNEFQSQLAWSWAGWVEERLIVDSGYTELVQSGKLPLKLLVCFRLKKGEDPDDTWKFWIIGWSQYHLHRGVRKYAVNRVKEVLWGDEDKMWGMPELWYENKEACDYDHHEFKTGFPGDPKSKETNANFHKRTEGNWGAFVEESIII
jgi:hypothetical protein